jgi:hypothetical protein
MSTIKKEIFSRIVELNTRQENRVELAVNDDLQKAYTAAINARKSSSDVYLNAKKAVESALQEIKSLKAINENFLPIYQKFEAMIKELGIPMPKEVENQKQNIQDGLKGTFTQFEKNLQQSKL